MHDLTALVPKADEGSWLTLLHPTTGVPLEQEPGKLMRIKLLGLDSEKLRALDFKLRNKRLKEISRRGGRVAATEAEKLEAAALETLVAATVAWENVSFNGPLACTPENAAKLYGELPWLREQVDTFINDLGNFL